MPIEHRYKVSVALLSLCNVWRRLNPLEQKFSWQGNNPSSVCDVSKSRLDRFYVHYSIMSSIQTCHIVPCSLSDHSAVTLINSPPKFETVALIGILTPSLRRPFKPAILFWTADRRTSEHAFRFLRVLPEAVSTRHSWL